MSVQPFEANFSQSSQSTIYFQLIVNQNPHRPLWSERQVKNTKVLIGDPKEIAAYERALKDGNPEKPNVADPAFMELMDELRSLPDAKSYQTEQDTDLQVH